MLPRLLAAPPWAPGLGAGSLAGPQRSIWPADELSKMLSAVRMARSAVSVKALRGRRRWMGLPLSGGRRARKDESTASPGGEA